MIGIKVTHNGQDLAYYGYSHLQKELGISKHIVKQWLKEKRNEFYSIKSRHTI